MQLAWVLCLCAVGGVNSLIIPDEVPSLLSLIYSNIPTFMKGTDSRVGWGFRLGDRADFQVLVELGPQKFTQPLANQGDGNSNSKRNVQHNLANTLYAQRQKEKNQLSDTDGGRFMQQWIQSLQAPKSTVQTVPSDPSASSIPLGVGEVDAKAVIPDDTILKLEELYGKTTGKPSTTVEAKTTIKPKTTTSYKDALDNVEIDD